MSLQNVLLEEDLLAMTGYESVGWLERWLNEQRIKFFRGKDGRIFTTITLLERRVLDDTVQSSTVDSGVAVGDFKKKR